MTATSDLRAVVVGGGLGGLAAALRLAARGWSVTVCEQSASFGGKMNRWSSDGFVFDTGPSLITMPWIFDDLFRAAGTSLAEQLELVEMRPLARYVYADGTSFDYTTSMPEWLATLQAIEPRDVDGFWRFLRLGAQLFELSKATFFRRSPLDPPDREGLRALRHLPIRHGWGNYHDTVAAHFRSPYLRQLFDRYPTYVGSSPYEAPATLAIIPYIEFAFGGWYVRGGLYRIVERLVALLTGAGASLLSNARVERIENDGRRAHGVILADGRRLPADVVVFNADASDASGLLGRPTKALPIEDRSMSGFVMLMGTTRTRPELPHHSVYFSSDYAREFSELFDRRQFPSDPTVYVNVPSRTDRSVVPGEGETLFVMANAPANGGAWTPYAIADARARVLRRLRAGGFATIDEEIAVEDIWTPSRIAERYAMPGGAIYGTHSHGWRRAFLRPPNRDRRVENLYYVGGSTHPGGGTPTVLLSAEIASGLIQQAIG